MNRKVLTPVLAIMLLAIATSASAEVVRMVRCEFQAEGAPDEVKTLVQVRTLSGDELLWEQPAVAFESLGDSLYGVDLEIPETLMALVDGQGGARYIAYLDARGATGGVWFKLLSVSDIDMETTPPSGSSAGATVPVYSIQGHAESLELATGTVPEAAP